MNRTAIVQDFFSQHKLSQTSALFTSAVQQSLVPLCQRCKVFTVLLTMVVHAPEAGRSGFLLSWSTCVNSQGIYYKHFKWHCHMLSPCAHDNTSNFKGLEKPLYNTNQCGSGLLFWPTTNLPNKEWSWVCLH